MKSAIRWSKASESTKRRVERIIAQGSHTARRAVTSAKRRELLGRVGYAQ